MKIKTSELSGSALDWAVSEAAEVAVVRRSGGMCCEVVLMDVQANKPWAPSANWRQGGPLIERFRIDLTFEREGVVFAELCESDGSFCIPYTGSFGSGYLIAAMRAIVSAKLGDEVDLPEGLV